MENMFDQVEENAGAYAEIANEGAGPLFRGLCATFKISKKYFEALIADGWDDPEQFQDLSPEWRDHILALAPNGGQKRNVEKLFDRVEAGPLSGPAPKKRRVQPSASSDDGKDKAGPSGISTVEAGPSQVAAAANQGSGSTSSQAKSALEVHKPRRLELLKACLETGYDRNVAYVMSLLRSYVDEFAPLSTEDMKEQQLYVNLLSDCTKHVQAKTPGIAMYIYKSITGEDSDKRLRFSRKHLGLSAPPSELKAQSSASQGFLNRPARQPLRFRGDLRQPRQGQFSRGPRERDVCFRCRRKGHYARDCKEIV
ncbi:uncharacterized protein LOC119728308 [Patiria miniata]|uniref:CCHC-type domain-containing protein n=1 Tax=Patiria miniata TaxID=46514 RepID=A0A913ZZD3_PATMI|nr:uncharacterized protein LOC119728308 [Patiria miniata]